MWTTMTLSYVIFTSFICSIVLIFWTLWCLGIYSMFCILLWTAMNAKWCWSYMEGYWVERGNGDGIRNELMDRMWEGWSWSYAGVWEVQKRCQRCRVKSMECGVWIMEDGSIGVRTWLQLTVAQKTVQMFACFGKIGLLWNADII